MLHFGIWVSVSAQRPFQEGFELCKPNLIEEFVTRFIKPSEVINGDPTSLKDYEHYIIGVPNAGQSGRTTISSRKRELRRQMRVPVMRPKMKKPKMKKPKMTKPVMTKPMMSTTKKPRTKRPTTSPTPAPVPVLNVFLHGTGSAPYRHSCILYSFAMSGPTIGLQYNNLDNPDGTRNQNCALEADTAQCLLDMHIQVLYGGNLRTNLWDEITGIESIEGRLGRLLKHLDQQYPEEGWTPYYIDGGAYPVPNWLHINISGHSQGSGHAAYIAQQEKCAGAGLLSGPQDECIGCPEGTKLWLDDPFATFGIAAFAHGDSREEYEPSLPVQIDNWSRMAATGTISWRSDRAVVPTDIMDHLDGDFMICDGPLVSLIEPSVDNTCGRAGHCSIALDKSAPYLMSSDGVKHFFYLANAWPAVNSAPDCNT
jgi:hypothetical protein